MIPTMSSLFNLDIKFVEVPTRTFYLDIYNNVSYGYTDGLKAMEQAIYLILQTERYQYVIFSWNYGVEFKDLFGMPISWVIPEVKRRIEEALLHDTRIKSVTDFNFNIGKNELLATFKVHTVFGDVDIKKVVSF